MGGIRVNPSNMFASPFALNGRLAQLSSAVLSSVEITSEANPRRVEKNREGTQLT